MISSAVIGMVRVLEGRIKLEDPSYIDNKVLGSVADSIMDMFGIS